jgi:hypothetical protein
MQILKLLSRSRAGLAIFVLPFLPEYSDVQYQVENLCPELFPDNFTRKTNLSQ